MVLATWKVLWVMLLGNGKYNIFLFDSQQEILIFTFIFSPIIIIIVRLMIILGAVTMFFGIVIFFCLIDNPRSRFLKLTPEQSQIVDERQRDNTTVITKEIKWSHITESLKEPRYYFFCLASMLINFQNGALNTFSAIITKGFGFAVSNIYIVIILFIYLHL